MKKFVLALILLTLAATPAYSVIIGVSPNVQNLCLVPGDNATAIFTVSSASNKTERLGVEVLNLSWVMADSWVEVPSMEGVPMTFYVGTAGVPEGYYRTDIHYCTNPVISGMTVKSCLKVQMNVNVSYACSPDYGKYLEAKNQREAWYYAASGIAVAAVLAAYALKKRAKKR